MQNKNKENKKKCMQIERK